MAPPLVLVACLMAGSLLTPSAELDPVAVKKLADAMGEATLKGEYARVVDYTYPPLVEKMGGREKLIAFLQTEMKKLKDQRIEIRSFKTGALSEFYTEGNFTFILVPTTTELTIPDGRVVLESYLLGISSNAGKTWSFMDGAGLELKEQRELLPKLPAKLKLPERKIPKVERTDG